MIFVTTLLFLQIALSAQRTQNVNFQAKEAAARSVIQCKPYGVRINLGRSVVDSSSQEKLGVRFNTAQPCQNLNLIINDKFIINCPLRTVSNFTMQKGEQFNSFIHQCSLRKQIEYNTKFSYNIIDQNSHKTYFSNDIDLTIKNPRQIRQVNFIHLADWAKINYKTDQLPSIVDPIKRLLVQRDIEAVIINGDLGYQIHSNVSHHLEFMDMLEQIAKLSPIIVNRGNHQYENASLFFCEYFQVYGLCEKNATSLEVGAAYLSLFDPQAALIPRKFKQYTESERLSSLQNLKIELKKGIESGKLIISLSHYPMVCSYPTTEHCAPNRQFKEFLPLYVNLQQHYNTLIDNMVPLVLSGHVHTYQRTHQLLKGYKYKLNKNQGSLVYVYKQGQEASLIQVIDGVAGSDFDLFQNYTYEGISHDVQPFLASYSLNHVGFGLLRVGRSDINYEHFSVNLNGSLTTLDNFSMLFPDRQNNTDEQL